MTAKKKKSAQKTEDMHVINKNKISKESERVEVVYTMTGQQEYLENDKYPCVDLDSETAQDASNAFAMKITIGKRIKYYAKRGKHGRLYNPIGMFSEGRVAKKLGHAGRLEWRFTEVGERVFNFYRDFLRTKNVAHLHNAERELL